MTEREFCFWLQGFFELNPGMATPSAEQVKAIREHLALVFTKVTPPVEGSKTAGTPPSGISGTCQSTATEGWAGTRVYC